MRRRAVVEQRGRLRRALRLEVGVRLVRPQRRSLEVGDGLVEDRRVARDREVAIDRVRQPEAIVRDPGPDAPTRRRMPPVLDVSLGELVGRGPQEVLPGELAPRGHQGDDVLELVAEPVGAAGLVERRPRPQPAGERLVDEPAVEHDVHRAVGRPHLDRALGVVPVARHAAQRRLVVGRPPAPDEVGRRRGVVRLAEQHDDLGPRSVGELEAGLQGGARIQAGAGGSLQPVIRGPGRRAGPERRCGRGTRSDRPSTPSAARRGRGRRPGRRTRCSTGCARGAPASPARAP